MIKVEAVVVRDKVETVMDAVEDRTGHVGVTVIEAVGHGRQPGITHEYRGRVFESRFLPKALLIFLVEDERAEAVVETIVEPRAPGTSPATGSSGRPRLGRDAQPHGTRRSRRWTCDQQGPRHRRLDDLGRRRGGARDVHAGGLRVPRGGADADEERRPHRGQERAHLRDRRSIVYYLVGFGIAFGDGGNGLVGGSGFLPDADDAARDRRGAVLLVLDDPGLGGVPLPGRLRGRLARDRLGRDGGADEALGLLRLRRRLHAHLLGRLALGLAPGRLALRARDAGLRRLDRRPLPGRAGGARGRAPARAAHSASTAQTGRRTRSPATTWPTRRSACSSSGSAGSASTPARRSASRAATSSATSPTSP